MGTPVIRPLSAFVDSRFLAPAALVVLLGLMAILAGGAALRESMAFDEAAHIGAGLSYVQKLDLRLNEEHPPLAKLLSGLSLAIGGTSADYSSISWTVSGSFFPAFLGEWAFGDRVVNHWNNPARTLALARLPMLDITLGLGWLLFIFGRRLGGVFGGLLCLTVFVTSPAFLAFGPLVLTDVAVALFSLWTLWAFADLWVEPSRRSVFLFALALAGALLSKFSAGILVVALITFALITRWWPVASQPTDKITARPWRKSRWRAARKGVLFAAIFVYAIYFLFSLNQPVDIPGFSGHGSLVTFAGHLLMPPWLFLRGLAVFVVMSARPTFLLGQWHAHGLWYFFPVIFVLKSAPGFLGLLVLALILAIVHKRAATNRAVLIPEPLRPHWRILWVGLIVFVAICMLSPMTISIRHFSVPIILLIVLGLAPLPALLRRVSALALPGARTLMPAIVISLAASCIFTAVAAYPYYFPYFNFLTLGQPAYVVATDSNVDWDQALPDVASFAAAHSVTDLPLDDYGIATTTVWVPQARYWDCQTPSAADDGKWVVVSANMLVDSHNCQYLFSYPHESLAGGGMYAFRLPPHLPPPGSPGGPPLASDFHYFPSGRTPPDIRPLFLEAVWHQEKIPEVMARFQAIYMESQKKNGKQ
jgi:hypothetical protein